MPFSSLLNSENTKKIKAIIERITPYLYREWHEIEPKLKVLHRRAKPSVERKLTRLAHEIEDAAKLADPGLSKSVNVFLTRTKDLFSFCTSSVKGVVSSSNMSNYFQGFTKSATEFEDCIVNELSGIDSEQKLRFENLSKFENILDKIDPSSPQFDTEVISYSKSDHFRNSMMNNYNASNLREERLSRIEEINDLHCLGFYAGSIALLYSQIEGVITDTLIDTGHVTIKNNKVVSHTDSKNSMLGLNWKMAYTKDNIGHLEEVFNKLSAVKFLDGERSRSISQSRNIIAHGSFIEVSDEAHSLCLLLSLYVIILKVRLMSDD